MDSSDSMQTPSAQLGLYQDSTQTARTPCGQLGVHADQVGRVQTSGLVLYGLEYQTFPLHLSAEVDLDHGMEIDVQNSTERFQIDSVGCPVQWNELQLQIVTGMKQQTARMFLHLDETCSHHSSRVLGLEVVWWQPTLEEVRQQEVLEEHCENDVADG